MSRPNRNRPPSPHHGILLIDKERGWTSHDVVAKVRGITGQRKTGHTGTLDPMATGLLVLCLGDATRLVEYMTAQDKRHEGTITLGATTDTDDAEGTVTATALVSPISESMLRALEGQFTGELMQTPPAYSAVKVAGQRAYAAARAGTALELAARRVFINRLTLERTAPAELRVTVECGPGTYIRSLARDIGERLGCVAHLSALRRTSVGHFDVEQAITLDTLQSAAEAQFDGVLWAADEGLLDTDAAILEAASATQFAHGGTVQTALKQAREATSLRIYDVSGTFRGIGAMDVSGALRALKVLANVE